MFNSGEYRAAIIQLKNAIQQDARNPAARVLLGRAYLRLGEAELAERELLAAEQVGAHPNLVLVPLGRAYLIQRKYGDVLSKVRPGHRGARIEAAVQDIRGRAYAALRNYKEAEQAFAEARRYQPKQAFPLLGQAQVKIELGKPDEAKALIEEAIRLKPENSDAWYALGELQHSQRNYEAALKSYSKAVELQPKNIPARLGRATILVRLRREQEALRDIEYVRTNEPRETRASYLYAQILTQAGDTNQAQAVLAEAEQLLKKRSPDFVRGHLPSLLLLGVIGYARGNYEDSFRYLSRYLELDPAHPGARKLMGAMLLRKGDTWAAIATLTPALSHAPEDTGILTLLGNAHMRLKQYTEAASYLEKAVAISPDSAGLRTQLGISRMGYGDADKAEDDFEAALDAEPDGSRPDLLLGLLHLRRGNFESALRTAQEIRAKDPTNPFAFNLAGAAELGKKNLTAARKQFDQALELAPNYAPALFNLARIDMAEGRVADARRRYEVVLVSHPKNVKAMDGLADIALSQGELEEAVKWLQQIVVIRPDAVQEHIKIINIYLRQNRRDAARGVAESLELAHPNVPLVLETYGRVLLVTRDFPAAAAKFERLAELSSEDPDGLLKAALLQEAAQDIAGARKTLTRAVKLRPESIPLRLELMRFEAREKNFETAMDMARAVQKAHPDFRGIDLVIGDLLMGEHRYGEAAAAYNAALAQSRTSEAIRRLYEAKRLSGRKEEALRLIASWTEEHPGDTRARRLLASAYLHNGRIEEAIKANERLLAQLPDDPAITNNLAGLYHKIDDPRALSFAEKAYSLTPHHWATLDTYGWVLLRAGQPEKGLELLRQAFTRAADNPEVRYHLAVALNLNGRKKEALEELERALEAAAEFDGIEKARALLRELTKK